MQYYLILQKQTGNGYFAPSQLQRHAGQANVRGQLTPWFGYYVAGTLGAEQAFRDPFRADGTILASTEFSLTQRAKFRLGYGYFRISTLTRTGLPPLGLYRTHSAFCTLEIQF